MDRDLRYSSAVHYNCASFYQLNTWNGIPWKKHFHALKMFCQIEDNNEMLGRFNLMLPLCGNQGHTQAEKMSNFRIK